MTRTLAVLLNGTRAGTVEQERGGRLSFTYDGAWRDSELAYPLSLSMPLAQLSHGDEVVRPYMEGLLPDSDIVLQAWSREFGVSSRNPLGLLAHVGEDVAGAVQFVRPDRVAGVANTTGSVAWLSAAQIGARLEQLARDRVSWRMPGDEGLFSLAGAQPKTALLREGDRWGVPSGSRPTTHVLKPPVMELDGLAENEHLCLRVAGALGLPAANSEVLDFDGRRAIVVERYDRHRHGAGVMRVHQEDLCQALAVSPQAKYEAEGGPGAAGVIGILRDHSSRPREDIDAFLGALALHWGLGAPDAHARNYSVLIAPRGQVRLAPLYDIISVLPYPERYFPGKVRLAMRVGGENRLTYLRRRHWDRMAEENDLAAEEVRARVRTVLQHLPDAVADECRSAVEEGLPGPFVTSYRDAVTHHARACAAWMK